MAKTESTAVNELIELVQSGKPPSAPSEDLMFQPPPLSAPRMTSTVPPVHVAGDVAPLPRARAPQGTQRHTIGSLPPVRVTTAPPVRSASIPPIPGSARSPVARAIEPPPVARAIGPAASAPAIGPAVSAIEPPDSLIATTPSLGAALRPQPAAENPRATMLGQGSRVVPPPRPSSPPPIPARPSASPAPAVPPETAPPAPASVAPVASKPDPVAAIAPASYPPAAPYLPQLAADMTSHQPWFDEDLAAEGIERHVSTTHVAKHADWKALLPRLILPGILMMVAGVCVGAYFALDGDDPATTASAAAAPAPAADEPAPLAEPPAGDAEPAAVEPPRAPTPTLVDLRIDSTPSGATVMLVDRGKTAFVGTTPLVTALDPSREYDLVFSRDSGPTHVEHVAPSATTKVAVVLPGPVKPAKQPRETRPQRVRRARPARARTAEARPTEARPARVAPAREAQDPDVAGKREIAAAKPAPAKPAPAKGVLMLSSKPPCEIYIDGSPTGLRTPQRAIELAAGKHQVTLVNADQQIRKTISVDITPDRPTKLIRDFMKQAR